MVHLGSYEAAWWRSWPFAAPALRALLPALGGRARRLTPLNSWCDWDVDLLQSLAKVVCESTVQNRPCVPVHIIMITWHWDLQVSTSCRHRHLFDDACSAHATINKIHIMNLLRCCHTCTTASKFRNLDARPVTSLVCLHGVYWPLWACCLA